MGLLNKENPLSFDEMYVRKLPRGRGRRYISQNHYSGGCKRSSMIWGLFSGNGELIGAIAFANPASEAVRASIFGPNHKNYVIELHRLYTEDKCPKNTESWFISRGLHELKGYKPHIRGVVSFADPAEGHIGTIYQATNAIYYGSSGIQRFYRDSGGRLRHQRDCGENITPEKAKKMGWEVENRPSKHRYLYLLPDDTYPKDILERMLLVEETDYPK